MIACDEIPTESSDPNENISDLNTAIDEALQLQPVIICFDEVDRITQLVSEVAPGRSSMTTWLRRLLKGKRFQKTQTFVLGVTNHPQCIDPSVTRCFEVPLYLEPTPLNVASKLLIEALGNNEVARRYLKNLKKFNMKPMGAAVARACTELKRIYSSLEGIPVDDLVNCLKANTPILPSEKQLRNYEKQNKDLIGFCKEHVIPYWLDIHERTKERKS